MSLSMRTTRLSRPLAPAIRSWGVAAALVRGVWVSAVAPGRRRLLAAAAFLGAAGLLLGCPPGGGGEGGGGGDAASLPEQAVQCPTNFPEDFPETRQIAIGTGTGADFAPYAAGQTAKLWHGNQGLNMITPSIQVEALPSEGEDACFRVRLDNDYQGAIPDVPDAVDSVQANVHFVRQGSSFVSDGSIYDAFSYSRDLLIGVDLKITATVQGPGFQGTTTVHVTLQ